jgi:hypothetical protein
MTLYNVSVCCQVEVSATGRSLVQGSQSYRVVCPSVIQEPHRLGPGRIGLSSQEKKNVAFRLIYGIKWFEYN